VCVCVCVGVIKPTVAAPRVWNYVPHDMRQSESLSTMQPRVAPLHCRTGSDHDVPEVGVYIFCAKTNTFASETS
jgi:hypothetical protein